MKKINLKNKKVLVVGMGISGRSAVHFLIHQEAIVYGVDRDAQLLDMNSEIQLLKQKGLVTQSEKEIEQLYHFDLIVLSPGVPSTHFIIEKANQAQIPIIGEIELGCQLTENPIIGITGTNGKTTVTLLVTHILSQCKKPAKALGNVGTPFTKELLTLSPQETIVLELSSYQIETLYQPCLNAALILNITPDHLDRYHTMEAYAQAKIQMERCLKENSPFYIEEHTWKRYSHLFKQKKPLLYGYEPSSFIYTDLKHVYREGKQVFELPTSLKNKKSHDLENVLAAFALCFDQGISAKEFIESWKTFKKPAHRIEFICQIQGVNYIDDSKGTNIDAVSRAVESIDSSIILIAGGVDKGFAYTSWAKAFKNKVKSICAIGQAAAKIEAQLASFIPVTILNSLEEAVLQASQIAQAGDTVLLSPGCASFDMFKDYVHRGLEFQRIVRELENCLLQRGE